MLDKFSVGRILNVANIIALYKLQIIVNIYIWVGDTYGRVTLLHVT